MKKREFDITIGITTNYKYEAENKIKEMLSSCEIVSVKCFKKRRTSQQNRALHLYFTLLATALNDAGMDMRKTIRRDVDIQWTSYSIKEFLWKPLQKALTGKKSTARIKTKDIDKVYDALNKVIGERTGVSVEFPSIESLMGYQEY